MVLLCSHCYDRIGCWCLLHVSRCAQGRRELSGAQIWQTAREQIAEALRTLGNRGTRRLNCRSFSVSYQLLLRSRWRDEVSAYEIPQRGNRRTWGPVRSDRIRRCLLWTKVHSRTTKPHSVL